MTEAAVDEVLEGLAEPRVAPDGMIVLCNDRLQSHWVKVPLYRDLLFLEIIAGHRMSIIGPKTSSGNLMVDIDIYTGKRWEYGYSNHL